MVLQNGLFNRGDMEHAHPLGSGERGENTQEIGSFASNLILGHTGFKANNQHFELPLKHAENSFSCCVLDQLKLPSILQEQYHVESIAVL